MLYCTDSRTIEPHQIFVALRGARFDGHDYLPAVAARGVQTAVVQKGTPSVAGLTFIEVDSPLAYWSAQARDFYAIQFRGKTIALTGSNGKTTVKELIKHLLGGCDKVHATQGNLNNEVGLPQTLFQVQGDETYSVIEMGAGQPGDIAYLRQWVQPDVALITNASAAHIGRYPDEQTLALTKGAMIQGLKPSAWVVLNADSSWYALWQGLHNNPCLTFGTHPQADVRLVSRRPEAQGQQVEWSYQGRVFQGFLPLKGTHNALNSAAALAVGLALNVPMEKMIARLASVEAVNGRLKVHFLMQGRLQLLDDSYNANPASVRAAIDVLSESGGEGWLVLGDLAELGDRAEQAHRELGEYAAQQGIARFFACGRWVQQAAQGFIEHRGSSVDCVQGREVSECVEPLMGAVRQFFAQAGDGVTLTLLVKGSRSSAMDGIVRNLLEREAEL